MKKITLLLLMLISGTVFAQTNPTTAPVNAVVVAPITLDNVNPLNFGTFAAPASGTETVTVPAVGSARIFSDPEMEITTLTTFSAASFDVTRDNAYNYTIALTVTQNPIETNGDIMTLDNLTTSTGSLTGNNASSFTVGGELSVDFDQTPGTYLGEIEVTLTYE